MLVFVEKVPVLVWIAGVVIYKVLVLVLLLKVVEELIDRGRP